MIEVWTDGACSLQAGGIGGWAWATEDGREAAGNERGTTNQRMELMAGLQAMRAIEHPMCIVSDSAYLINCFEQKWYVGWLERNWRTAGEKKKPVANQDLWEALIDAYLDGEVMFRKVRGHSGDRMNEYVDRLCVAAKEKLR